MRREGTDEANVQMSDVLCDYCHNPWTHDTPAIEGHRGAIICGPCLTAAYADVVIRARPTAHPGYTCTMCLEQRQDHGWASPRFPQANVCARCIDLAVTTLEKDSDWHWKRPA